MRLLLLLAMWLVAITQVSPAQAERVCYVGAGNHVWITGNPDPFKSAREIIDRDFQRRISLADQRLRADLANQVDSYQAAQEYREAVDRAESARLQALIVLYGQPCSAAEFERVKRHFDGRPAWQSWYFTIMFSDGLPYCSYSDWDRIYYPLPVRYRYGYARDSYYLWRRVIAPPTYYQRREDRRPIYSAPPRNEWRRPDRRASSVFGLLPSHREAAQRRDPVTIAPPARDRAREPDRGRTPRDFFSRADRSPVAPPTRSEWRQPDRSRSNAVPSVQTRPDRSGSDSRLFGMMNRRSNSSSSSKSRDSTPSAAPPPARDRAREPATTPPSTQKRDLRDLFRRR